jgi:AraC-like DNA-binding protein
LTRNSSGFALASRPTEAGVEANSHLHDTTTRSGTQSKQVSRIAALRRSSLHRLFRQQTRMTISEYLAQLIGNACTLLINSEKNRWLSLRIKSDIETRPTSIVSSKRRRGTRRENFAGPSTPTASDDLVRIAASMLAVPGRSGMNFSNPLTCPEESCGVNFAFLEPGVQGQKSGVQLVSDKRCQLGSKRHLGSHPQPLFSISDPVHESLSRRYRRSTTGRIRRVHRAHHLAFSSSKRDDSIGPVPCARVFYQSTHSFDQSSNVCWGKSSCHQ